MTIKEIREGMGLTQKQFSQKFRLNLRTLQSWEQGERKEPDYLAEMIEKINTLENEMEKRGKKDGKEKN